MIQHSEQVTPQQEFKVTSVKNDVTFVETHKFRLVMSIKSAVTLLYFMVATCSIS